MNHRPSIQKLGFTLLELMVAMVILTIALAIAFQAFNGTIRGWKRGTQVMEHIKHGQFAMMQLANALNSTVYFFSDRKSYAFTFEKNAGNSSSFPADTISWVTASDAFMPYDSALKHGPHRITLYIDSADNGEYGLFAEALPPVADPEEYDAEPMLITTGIQGLECTFYDEEQEQWTDEWEPENSIPERIKIDLYAPPKDDDDEEVVFTRIFEIPVAASVPLRLKGPSSGSRSKGRNTGHITGRR